jgi:hypothetical protein
MCACSRHGRLDLGLPVVRDTSCVELSARRARFRPPPSVRRPRSELRGMTELRPEWSYRAASIRRSSARRESLCGDDCRPRAAPLEHCVRRDGRPVHHFRNARQPTLRALRLQLAPGRRHPRPTAASTTPSGR